MWQRIQTLYLFLATVFIGLMFFCSKAVAIGPAEPEQIRFTAYFPYTILLVIITLLDLLAISAYKFRIFQMRTAVLAAIITLAFQIWLAVDYFTSGDSVRFYLTVLFPLAAIIMDLLAARGIFADELMVRSASRLRSSKNHRKK